MAGKRALNRSDIISLADYAKDRAERRRQITALKRDRRVEVGPFATFYFENFETIWHQVHEMLYIEKGGEAQIADELAAYNPLIPQGKELVATVMLEIDDEIRRKRTLQRLGGIEDHMLMRVGDSEIRGVPEGERENTREEDNKASSVQFVHFPFTPDQIAAFRDPKIPVLLGFDHENYGHLAVVSDKVRQALALDFD